jgi:hypothetical protein
MLTIRSLVVALAGLFVVAAASTAAADSNDGVVCRTKNAEGTNQLVLHWDGNSAKGTLEHKGQSGNVTTTKVRAERHEGLIIADDVFQQDLVSHAAVISVKNGKKYMRTESVWLACE